MPPGEATARRVASRVLDPELPTLTLEDLGVLRSVQVEPSGKVLVVLTPTYSGCPALEVMKRDVTDALFAAGFTDVQVDIELQPAWTTESLGRQARQKLAQAGIAPPPDRVAEALPLRLSLRCPSCGSVRTHEISRFGATACKSLWRCLACGEPFEHFKTHL